MVVVLAVLLTVALILSLLQFAYFFIYRPYKKRTTVSEEQAVENVAYDDVHQVNMEILEKI